MKKYKLFICIFAVFFAFCMASCKNYSAEADYYTYYLNRYDDIHLSKDSEKNIVITPDEVKAAYVFYPGALVNYDSYMPLMVSLARKGVQVFIVKMPANLAIMDSGAAKKIIRNPAYSSVTEWYIGGHSLGGSMAARYCSDNPKAFKGIIFLASYSVNDLSPYPLRALSVYGSEDKVLKTEKYESNKVNLPSDFTEVRIEGGNHAYFGNYGEQDGDGTASISQDRQQQETVDAIAAFLGL